MADRSIVIRLRAEVGAYKQSLAEAAKATREVGEQATKSAKNNREAWTTAGTALTAYGVGITALGGALLKTGIAYNQLRQQSTAALTTILGSASAAADQMDRLDDFARNSPFARQTFIAAQQQMLAFGIEASKVVPYLDAIQNAVAAAGGSNAEIEGIVATMSKIQSSAKITAQDLNEFGNRGVNAADLIGSQMGMTGAQIREAITDGSLDAQMALDALAAGMSERFDGAADNVKDTFAGAIDRVKAAWRDFASELATPLVDPTGGGYLVDLANHAADAMRAYQGLSPETKNLAAATIGLSGAAALAGGAFLLVFPRVMAAREAMKTLRKDMPIVGGAIDGVTRSVVALSTAFLAAKAAGAFLDRHQIASVTQFGAALANLEVDAAGARQKLDELASASVMDSWLDKINSLGGLLDSGSSAISDNINGVADAISALDLGPLDKVGNWFAGLTRETRADVASDVIKNIDAALADLVNRGNLDAAAAGAEYFADEAAKAGKSTKEAADMLPAYGDALAALELSGDGAADAISGYTKEAAAAAAASEREAAAINEAVEAMRNKRTAALSAINAEIGYHAAIADATDALEENGRNLDLTTEKGRSNMAALTSLAASWNNLSDRQKNATGASREARRQFVEMATSMGMGEEKAKRLADRLLEIKPRRVRVDVETSAAEAGIARVRNALSALRGSMSSLGSINPLGGVSVPRMNPVRDRAQGGYISGPGGPTDDLIPARLSNGEYVIRASAVDHYGIGTFDALNAKQFAAGGSVGAIGRDARQAFDLRGGMTAREVGREFAELRKALGRNTDALTVAQKHSERLARAWNRLDQRIERREQRLSDVRADRASLVSSAAGSFNNDIFGGGVSGLRLQLEADRNDARAMRQALGGTKGLGKGLLEALAASGDLMTAQELQRMSRRDVRSLSALYNQRGNAQQALGVYAGNAVYGQEIKAQRQTLDRLNATLKDVNRRLNSWERAAEKMPNATAREIRRAVHAQALPAGRRNR